MSKPPSKRTSLLDNTERRNRDFRAKLIGAATVKSGVEAELAKAERKAKLAREGITSEKGEQLVEAASSASSKFAECFAIVGIGTTAGGWKTSQSSWADIKHKQWIESARKLVREGPNKINKSEIARNVATHFRANEHTVRGVLQKSGIYDR